MAAGRRAAPRRTPGARGATAPRDHVARRRPGRCPSTRSTPGRSSSPWTGSGRSRSRPCSVRSGAAWPCWRRRRARRGLVASGRPWPRAGAGSTRRSVGRSPRPPWERPRSSSRIRGLGIAVLTIESAGYPGRLRLLDLPPPVLFVRGDAGALDPSVLDRRGRHAARHRAWAAHCRRDRRGALHRRRGGRLGTRGGDRRCGARGGGRLRRAHGGRARLRPPAALPAGPRASRRPDRRGRGRGRLGAGAGRRPASGHVPAPEPRDQRPGRRDGHRRGKRTQRRPDHGQLGAGAGAGVLRRARPARRRPEPGLQSPTAALPGPGSRRAGDPRAPGGPRPGRGRRIRPARTARRSAAARPSARIRRSSLPRSALRRHVVARALLPRAATLEELVDATGFAPATILAVLTRLEGNGLVVAALGRYAAGGQLGRDRAAPRSSRSVPARVAPALARWPTPGVTAGTARRAGCRGLPPRDGRW